MALYIGSKKVCPVVKVGEIHNQDKTITENGQYTADTGYTGLGTVTVNVPDSDIVTATNNVGSSITEGDKVWLNENNGSYTIEKLKEVRNFEVIGSPTIDDSTGIVSEFSSSKYLTTRENIGFIGEQTYKVQTGSSFNNDDYNYIASSAPGPVSLSTSGYLRIWSNNSSAWINSSTQLSTNTIYWIRYIIRENNKEIQYSTNGINFTSALILNESSEPGAEKIYIGHNQFKSSSYWRGTIYIKDCYFKVNGQNVWTPYLSCVTENTLMGYAQENIASGSTGQVKTILPTPAQ